MQIGIRLCVDSNDPLSSLPTQRILISRFNCADVASIQYRFRVCYAAETTQLPGKLNLADVLTKNKQFVIKSSSVEVIPKKNRSFI